MEEAVRLPILEGVLPGGLKFGANYLVEFEPQSLWYETSLTLVAQALKAGHKADLHTFTHIPDDVRDSLKRQGLDVKKLEEVDKFRIWDSYTVQGGIDVSAKIGMATPRERVDLRSVKISDWDRENVAELKAGLPEVDMERLHVDDNTSVLLQYSTENEVIDHFRAVTVQHARKSRLAAFHSLVSGVYSENFYKQFESFCDGIIDFKAVEESGRITQLMRVRLARGAGHDSTWRMLRIGASGEVAIDETVAAATELSGAALQLTSFLDDREFIDLGRYAVAGSYIRFDDAARNTLKDFRSKVISAFSSRSPKHENYLL